MVFNMTEYMRKYYQNNKEKFKESVRKYQKSPKGKRTIKAWRKKYRERNNELRKIWERKRRKEDSNFRIANRLRSLLNMTLKRYVATGNINSNSAYRYTIDWEGIINHLKPFPKDKSKYHVDHIKPLSTFDLTDPKQVKLAYAPENLQWLTPLENLKKSNKETKH